MDSREERDRARVQPLLSLMRRCRHETVCRLRGARRPSEMVDRIRPLFLASDSGDAWLALQDAARERDTGPFARVWVLGH